MQAKDKILALVVAILLIVAIAIAMFHHYKSPVKLAPSALVQLYKVQYVPMSKYLVTYGTVTFPPEQIHQLSFQHEVVVQEILVTQGQQVKINDHLMLLSMSANANLNVENAKISVDFAKRELDRMTKLRTQYLATNSDVLTAKQNLDKAEATSRNLLVQQQNENGKILVANFDGTILSINVQTGQVVPPSIALLSYASDDRRQVRLGVENEDLVNVHIGQQVIITPLQNEKIGFKGNISSVTGQVDPNTGLIDVIVPLDKAAGLIPGILVRGEIILKPNTNALAVPHNAVLFENNKAYLFVAINGRAVKRWVTIGEDNGQFVSILKGLQANENVVTLGNYELQNDMPIREVHQ
jgi:membrane fusion protein (multidrug efflux system)